MFSKIQIRFKALFHCIINSIILFPYKNSLIVDAWVNMEYGRVSHNNWGDDINVYFIEAITKKKVIIKNCSLFHRVFQSKSFICIGSIIGKYEDKNSIVWGSGAISSDTKIKSKRCQINSVRGPLTRQLLLDQGIECPPVYGDPALLISKFYKPKNTHRYKYGFVLHNVDADNQIVQQFLRTTNDEATVISLSIYRNWTDVVDQICSCDVIFSSSLHGLIIADSYSIPNVWISLSNAIIGGKFKYLDYFKSVNRQDSDPVMIRCHEDLLSLLSNQPKITCHIDYDSIINSCPFDICAQYYQ